MPQSSNLWPCTCLSFGCKDSIDGFRNVQAVTFRRHQERDAQQQQRRSAGAGGATASGPSVVDADAEVPLLETDIDAAAAVNSPAMTHRSDSPPRDLHDEPAAAILSDDDDDEPDGLVPTLSEDEDAYVGERLGWSGAANVGDASHSDADDTIEGNEGLRGDMDRPEVRSTDTVYELFHLLGRTIWLLQPKNYLTILTSRWLQPWKKYLL